MQGALFERNVDTMAINPETLPNGPDTGAPAEVAAPARPLTRVETLRQEIAALEKQIEETRENDRIEAFTQIHAILAEFQIPETELLNELERTLGRGRGKRASASPMAGGKVAPKYRDTATGNTWSGRGIQPNWLKSRLAEGRKLEDFAIAN